MSYTAQTQAYLLNDEFQDGQAPGSIVPGRVRDFIGSSFNVVPAVVAAAGTTLGTATALTAQFNVVTSGTGGVVATAGYTKVWNASGATINVYPPNSSAQFNTLGNGVAGEVVNGGSAEFVMTSSTQGYAR